MNQMNQCVFNEFVYRKKSEMACEHRVKRVHDVFGAFTDAEAIRLLEVAKSPWASVNLSS